MTKNIKRKDLNLKEAYNNGRIEDLYKKVASHLHNAQTRIFRSICTEQLQAYWLIGRDIVEEEQQGKARSEYGENLIQEISSRLTKDFGKGFSIATVKNIRQFYLSYPQGSQIGYAVRSESSIPPKFDENLSWTHYRSLMRIHRPEARSFYEIEASRNRWSSRELERQINSLLFERLAKSRDKQGLMKLAQKGQEILAPQDAIKDPIVLEFLGIPEAHQLTETKLEEALISNLQQFLLELGKGFAFISRQKRLTLDGDHFYADLVFYHTILKCYIIIDLKTRKLTHADLGQMQLYVNYFDQECRTEGDNPTLGLILCTEKNHAVVRYTLGEKAKQIFTSKYQFYLPTEEELEAELKRELQALKKKIVQ